MPFKQAARIVIQRHVLYSCLGGPSCIPEDGTPLLEPVSSFPKLQQNDQNDARWYRPKGSSLGLFKIERCEPTSPSMVSKYNNIII